MDDDDLAVRLRKEKEERRADVLNELEIPKRNFLSALEKQGSKNQQNRTNLEGWINYKPAKILETNEYFCMSHYLCCAEAVCNAFRADLPRSDDSLDAKDLGFSYILTHARLFGDQSRTMFPLACYGMKSRFRPPFLYAYPSHPVSEYMKTITALIKGLKLRYDETKYRILNANLTYITLLILRRRVQGAWEFLNSYQHNITSNDYRELCPHPFPYELPRMNLNMSRRLREEGLLEPVCLAIHAFFTVDDDLTKMILKRTCIQYFEWYRMELPDLFFKVVSLYGIAEARLWELLSSEKTSKSLHRLADVFNTDISPEIVPYGMVLLEDRQPDIERQFLAYTGDSNVYLCTILAHIVDRKIGFDKSFIRNSDWAEDRAANKAGRKIAKLIHQFYSQ